jgi:energy-coupling factor transporter ATP-binding protein EcfA2
MTYISINDLTKGKHETMNTTPFHNSDTDEFPIAHYFTDQTDKWMTTYEYISGYSFKLEEMKAWLTKWNFEEIHSTNYTSYKKYSESKVFKKLVLDQNQKPALVLIKINPFNETNITKDDDDDYNEGGITLYSNISNDGFQLLKDSLLKILKKKPKKENNISLIVQTRHGYDTQTFDLPKQKLDLDYNYGSSFMPIHDKILKTLNQKKGKGLVLLHGEPGCGKTFYLKYLASQIKTKKVMFVPPYMVDFITSPEMTPFLIENSDSILFIEDAERVITDRDMNSANGVSNILNLTDGILGDILNIQIVATFNMDRAKIDKALLRKGRLIAEHEFGKLGVDESNKLLKHLGKNTITDEPLTLTQIYNIEETEYKVEDKTSKIGFGR